MNNNKIILAALASDLKRITLGLQRKSFTMARRFEQEALKRKAEIDTRDLAPYMQSLLSKLEKTLSNNDQEKKAEDALLFSILIQNYVRYR